MLDVLSSVELLISQSVGVKGGPTNTGSVGPGEGLTSGTNEDADDGDMGATDFVVVGMTLEKEDKTDVLPPTALTSPSEGDGTRKRDDSVTVGVA